MFPFHHLFSYLEYKLNAVDSHSLHSPFVFDFYQNIIKGKQNLEVFDEIESYRKALLRTDESIVINDYGAGSQVNKSGKRKISDLARSGLSSGKFSRMLFRLVDFLGGGEIVELGTSFGINTLYLAKSNPRAHIITFEGCTESIKIARGLFNKAGQSNIEMIEGNIDLTLDAFTKEAGRINLVYFDANHQYDATLRYYHQLRPLAHADTIFVIDDIYWSQPMKKAWKELVALPEVTLSMDIFDAGLLFFNQDFCKEHFVLEF